MDINQAEEIDRIWRLKLDGSITDDEYVALKRRIIDGAPVQQPATKTSVRDSAAERQREMPLFTILAGIFAFVCLFCPAIMITLPVMITLGVGVAAVARKERPRWVAPAACVFAIVIAVWAANQIDTVRDNLNNIGAEFNSSGTQN